MTAGDVAPAGLSAVIDRRYSTHVMMQAMFLRFFASIILALFLVTSAAAQGTNVTITPDLRLFTAMAALNAAGFDIEFGNQYHPVREAVRKYASEVDPDLISRLKATYKSRQGNQTDFVEITSS